MHLHTSGMDRLRRNDRRFIGKYDQVFEPRKSTLPAQRESQKYLSANGVPKPDSSIAHKSAYKKPFDGPPRKFKFQRLKYLAVYTSRYKQCHY